MTNAKATVLDALNALSDPTRREVFERIGTRPRPVTALATGLPVSRSAVSQHLKVLKEAGLVTETAQGTRRIYRLDPRGIGAVREWLDGHWATALADFQAFADAHAAQQEEPKP